MKPLVNYNLILYNVPERQGISDLMTIRNILIGRAPDIEVHILSTGVAVHADFWPMAAKRPSLIFSFAAVPIDAGARGTRLISYPLAKLEENELMTAAGFAIPETRLITPETRFDEAQWGAFTVVKPNRGLRKRGVRLMRTRDVSWIDTSGLAPDDPLHGEEFLAQRFVDTGPHAVCYRVMTVLGRPIYCVKSTAVEKRPDLDIAVAANGMARKMTLSNDGEIIDLATSLHAALPHLPVMGVDIIREEGTGRLHILEFNSHGLVWHLSSKLGLAQQRDNAINYYGQFDALGTIADALIEATRERAV